MSAKSFKLQVVMLLPDELGNLLYWLRIMESFDDCDNPKWAEAAGRAIHAAQVAFAHAIAEKDDAVLLALATPTMVNMRKRGDLGPLAKDSK